ANELSAAQITTHRQTENVTPSGQVTPKLQIRNLCKSFAALAATHDANLEVYPGELHALIGPNGAGKTTLISQISGELFPDSGQILFDGQDITRLPAHKRAAVG